LLLEAVGIGEITGIAVHRFTLGIYFPASLFLNRISTNFRCDATGISRKVYVKPRIFLFVISILLLIHAGAYAQEPRHEFGRMKNEFVIWNADSFASGHIFGFAQNRSLYLTGFRYGMMILERQRISLRYTIEAIPAAVLSEPYADGRPVLGFLGRISPHREIYGGGLNPIGLQLNFRARKRVQPFGSFNGGFLYFSRKVLSPEASQFNFTVAMGGGVEIFTSSNRAIQIGYRYHHLSNANITDRNPGTDSNMIYFGFSFLR